MEFFNILMIVITGVFAGFLNVTAGGGSLLVLPLLVFSGLDMSVANATNRVAILLQNSVALAKFKKEKILSLKEAVFFAVPASLGSVLGTSLAITMDDRALKLVIAFLILVMAILLVLKPKMWEEQSRQAIPGWGLLIVFFFIGVYGGFIQAGVGFFLLWGLAGLAGKDLLHANAVKVAIIATYTTISLLMFLVNGMVNIPVGLLLAAGSMTGGYLGVRFSIGKGNRWLRLILVSVVTLSAARMIFNAISGM
jgi:hypothetical protein